MTKEELNCALENIEALVEYAYEMGFHEMGYDPVEDLKTYIRELEERVKELDIAWAEAIVERDTIQSKYDRLKEDLKIETINYEEE